MWFSPKKLYIRACVFTPYAGFRNTIYGHAYEQWRKQTPKIPGRITHIEIGNEAYSPPPETQTHRCLLNKYIFSTYDVYKPTKPAVSIFTASFVVIGSTTWFPPRDAVTRIEMLDNGWLKPVNSTSKNGSDSWVGIARPNFLIKLPANLHRAKEKKKGARLYA